MNYLELKNFAQKYRYRIFIIYYSLYMLAFMMIEKYVPSDLYIIRCPLDQYIPFVEIFVIPYLAWFLYIGGIVIWLFFIDREQMCRLLWCGMIGMTAFVLISIFLPNGLDLRPEYFERDNIFVRLTMMVYGSDTATNVFPSIHVNNSICACVALLSCEKMKDRKVVNTFAVIMAVLIILSTMFLKQHSIVDVTAGMITGFASSELIFGTRIRDCWAHVRLQAMRRKRYASKLLR